MEQQEVAAGEDNGVEGGQGQQGPGELGGMKMKRGQEGGWGQSSLPFLLLTWLESLRLLHLVFSWPWVQRSPSGSLLLDPVNLRFTWLLKNSNNNNKKRETKLYRTLVICKINVILETNKPFYEKKKTLQGFPNLLFVSLEITPGWKDKLLSNNF